MSKSSFIEGGFFVRREKGYLKIKMSYMAIKGFIRK